MNAFHGHMQTSVCGTFRSIGRGARATAGRYRAKTLTACAVILALLPGCGRIGVELIAAVDAPSLDAGDGSLDATFESVDAGPTDGTLPDGDLADDAGLDAGALDAGVTVLDAETDSAAFADSGALDVGLEAAVNQDAANQTDAADAASCVWTSFGAPEEITGLMLSGEIWGPSLSADGRTLYLAENTGSDERIMMATRSGGGPAFSTAVEVPSLLSAGYDGTPFISRDDLSMYFFSTRTGGVGDRDLWLAQRATSQAGFAAPVWIANVNSSVIDQLPRLSPDEATLVFTSNRPGGLGDSDIWKAPRIAGGFGSAVSWTELNSSVYDAAATFSSDGRLVVFASDRAGGQGSKDLWMAVRSTPQDPFGVPTNLSVANSNTSEADCALSPDDSELFFVSYRSGQRKLWRMVRSCN